MSGIAPVLFIVFNRPDTTARVFEAIRQARPALLLVAADGPRNEEERTVTEAVRRITKSIDWPCEVHYDFSEKNLGCKRRVYSAISWAFEQVDSLIILEDDCLPHPDFFEFCSETLLRYSDSNQIGSISGINIFSNNHEKQFSYLFAKLGGIWGWATWKRIWNSFEINKYESLSSNDRKQIRRYLGKGYLSEFYISQIASLKDGKIDTWDFQWVVYNLLNQYLSILPASNLISNIGFRSDATHTKGESDISRRLQQVETVKPIKHPNEIRINSDYLTHFQDFLVQINGKRQPFSEKVMAAFKRRIQRYYRRFSQGLGFDIRLNVLGDQNENSLQKSNFTCAKSAQLRASAKINNFPSRKSRIVIGEHTIISGEITLLSYGGRIIIGDYCFVGLGTRIWSTLNISIGNNVHISNNVFIADAISNKMNIFERRYSFEKLIKHPPQSEVVSIESAQIVIEDNVWIYPNCIILKGVSIGEGSIIAEGTFVTKSIPPFSFVRNNNGLIVESIISSTNS